MSVPDQVSPFRLNTPINNKGNLLNVKQKEMGKLQAGGGEAAAREGPTGKQGDAGRPSTRVREFTVNPASHFTFGNVKFYIRRRKSAKAV